MPPNRQSGKGGSSAQAVRVADAQAAPSIAERIPVANVFGISLARITFRDLCGLIEERIVSRTPSYVVTTNVDHVCKLQKDARFREAYHRALVAVADGQPVLWASHLFRAAVPEKLSGSDLLPWVCSWAASKGYSVFFLGGTPGTAERTAEILRDNEPNLQIAGINCPEYGFDRDPRQLESILAHLRRAKPDICFVGLGSPKQEIWMSHYSKRSGVPVMIGVGGSFDFVSGRIVRAPGWVQRAGLEWLWRLSMEPRRLWRRYLVEDVAFFQLVALEFVKRIRHWFT